jgi:predicted GNAT family N-acyltransferase
MKNNISLLEEYSFNDVVALMKEEGWKAYLVDLDELRKAFLNSFNIYSIMRNEEFIGFVRLLGDGIHTLVIQDILIKKDERKKGYGTEVMKKLIEIYKNVRQKIVLCDFDDKLSKYYKNTGFKKINEYGIECFGML